MKPHPIETAPGNVFIILQDDRNHSDVHEIARWSVERNKWIREDGEPAQIIPTHWRPLDHLSRHKEMLRRWRFGICAVLFVAATLAAPFVPSFLSYLGVQQERDTLAVAETARGATKDAENARTKTSPGDGWPASGLASPP